MFAQEGFGTLHMPVEMPPVAEVVPQWADSVLKMAALSVCIILFVISTPIFFRLFPDLVKSVFRRHGPSTFEHSYQKARSRNLLLWLMIPEALLINSRLDIIHLAFFDSIQSWLAPLIVLAMFCLYYILRVIIINSAKLRSLRSDDWDALKNNILSVAVFAWYLLCPIILILLKIGILDDDIRLITMVVVSFFYLLSLVRSGQILRVQCGVVSTFLYLCAFELLPAALLVIAVIKNV